jgi:hypothetical protein
MIGYMKATQYANQKIKLPDGSLVSVVIWQLPEPSDEQPHGLKYRLNYCTADGATLIRYDNEKGKGDHKHIGNEQESYTFKGIGTLLDDFWRDVDEILEQRQHE